MTSEDSERLLRIEEAIARVHDDLTDVGLMRFGAVQTIHKALTDLTDAFIWFINIRIEEKKTMSDTLASIKDKIHAMKEAHTVDWPLIIDALELLTDSLIAAQQHGPPAPPATPLSKDAEHADEAEKTDTL
jgi:hypothetical protein